jgi:pyroglutamyl-peptidase
MNVLITGFGRFPGAPFNPSAPLARGLGKRRRPAFDGLQRVVHIFETSYAAVDRDLPGLLAKDKPDIVLMFGLAGRAQVVRIETLARNARSVLFPDVTGHRPNDRAIAKGKPAMRGHAPFARLLGAVRASGARARLSRDAGGYLCNYTYWRGLEASRSGTPLVQFIHIPLLARVPRAPGKKRRISHAALLRAAEAILLTLLAARRN